ncbi:MAG: glycosyltransferase family 39 protein [Acidobacteriota bacterium]|nr:glycosyltransferase family 39 protein [Acidobacteriota bacterium]
MNETIVSNEKAAEIFWRSSVAIVLGFALVKIVLHFVFNSNYGYFRDELYYIACSEHLDFGYPDHAPLIAFSTKISRAIFGDSLFAIRLFPALAGAAKIVLTGLLAKEFGGKRFAVFLACLCVLCAPVYLGIDNFLSMNSFEPVFWMACVYFAVLAIKRENPRWWIWFGAFAGIALINKHSAVFFGLAMFAGLILTRTRKVFADKWIWIAGAIAFLIFLPNLIWQFQNNFATLELLQNVQKSGKNVVLSPPAFIFSQIFMLLPTTFPVWFAGVWFFLADKNGKRFRFLGICYLVLLALMIFLKAKDYYLAPIYPMLFAAGAVWWEQTIEQIYGLRFLKFALPTLIISLAAVALPFALPALPVESFLRYETALGIKPPKTEVSHEGVLPQIYGDQFGWREMVEKVADVYNSLPPEEREKVGIYASNYGEAGAIDFFGAEYSLPKAISGHQSYFLWGYHDYTGEVLIVLGSKREDAEKNCQSVEEKTEVNHPYSMNEEKYKILICRGLKQPLPELWSKLKHWN